MTRSQVVAQSCNANKNVSNRADMNPLLDTRMLKVELAKGEVTESTANVIAESMHT